MQSQSAYKLIRFILAVFGAFYTSFMGYMLKAWATVAFDGIERGTFIVSLVVLVVGAWIWAAYEGYRFVVKTPLPFTKLILKMIGKVAGLDFKASAKDFAGQTLAMWKGFLDEQIDRMDKSDLVLDVGIVWFIGQILLLVGIVAAYRMPYPFLGALLCFALAGLSVIFTIMAWESGKYVWKNGLVGYKHNRRQA